MATIETQSKNVCHASGFKGVGGLVVKTPPPSILDVPGAREHEFKSQAIHSDCILKIAENIAPSSGNPRICIAVLDGPVDCSHPCFRGAELEVVPTWVNADTNGASAAHGTHVASIIFGQLGSAVQGIAPKCRGLIIPIFGDAPGGGVASCLQLDLARAILMAVDRGAHIINISGGQPTSSAEPDPLLADAIRTCAERNVLIVAAAGNDGCDCLHLPAAARSVLSVGAADADGNPIASSNWGNVYQTQGVIAPGEDLLGATPGGGTSRKSGTSFATAVVSGVAGLLLSLQLRGGQTLDPHEVRSALLETARQCIPEADRDHRRCLAGHIDVNEAMALIRGGRKMTSLSLAALSESTIESEMERAHQVPVSPAIQPYADSAIVPSEVTTAAPAVQGNIAGVVPSCGGDAKCNCQSKESCGCGGGAQKPALVYALGKIGVDFGTESRRDYFFQAVQPPPTPDDEPPLPSVPLDTPHLLTHLKDHPTDSQAIIWTLNLDATPVYAIQPSGAFAAAAYERLRESLQAQVGEGVEMVSVPGYVSGSIRLLSGQLVPVIVPSIRGMFDWRINALVDMLLGGTPDEGKKPTRPRRGGPAADEPGDRDLVRGRVIDFLNRIYSELRNLGITGEERALNFTATAAMRVKAVFESATHQQLDLDKIALGRSGVCRPGSECFDIDLSFFNPNNMNIASRVFRFTVDVSDVIPVEIGRTRTWTRRA
ncbi:MAG: hypothetical protein QOI05_608 [Bradyrhizobium sp.]|jgi:cyanobactin maturation PatA/PatG family protease|nr:hypothetical protein [Bradyrhizobium sp.]